MNVRTNAIALLMGGMLAAAPVVYSGESATMSDSQHRKTMGGGMQHPDKE